VPSGPLPPRAPGRRPRTTRLVAAVAATGAASVASLLSLTGPAAASPVAPRVVTHHSQETFAVGPAPLADVTNGSCTLANGVQHVVFVGFDNFHLRRDNANSIANNGDGNLNTDLNIPSDLEQVPTLYNFLRGSAKTPATTNPTTADNANYADGRSRTYTDGSPFSGGTILANQHTPIISHTSVDFTTTYSGLYGDRHGVPVAANSFGVYGNNGAGTVGSNSAFSYWTDPLPNGGGDTAPVLVTGKKSDGTYLNTPAPWVPFTRAGCDVGSVAATGFVPENTNTVNSFYAPAAPAAPVTQANYVGVSVHCAIHSKVCGTDPGDSNVAASGSGVQTADDKLPSQPVAYPGGQDGYKALYGSVNVLPAINDLTGGTRGSTTVPLLRPNTTNNGFPGFDSETGNYTLGLTLDMQKAGIPITFGYLSGAHFCHSSTTREDHDTCPNGNAENRALGSGQAQYETVLSQLNSDFTSFFDQAKAANLTTANTEFVFYSDENDTVPESAPSNPTCDGVTTACQWNNNTTQRLSAPPAGGGQIGEVTVGIDGLLPAGDRDLGGSGGTTQGAGPNPYFLNNDTAPDFSLSPDTSANGSTNQPPAQTSARVRRFEHDIAGVTYTDPFGQGTKPFTVRQASQTELGALHMITADPLRSPTETVFSQPEVYAQKAPCTSTQQVCSDTGFAYVHGNIDERPTTTWAGFTGPGVANNGVDGTTWTDETDLRPTTLSLVGLQDEYTEDGRVITQLESAPKPAAATTTATRLGLLLKQLNAPVYQSASGADDGFGRATLQADTTALAYDPSTDAAAGHFTDTEARIATITAQRDAVSSDIKNQLTQASFNGTPIDATAAAKDTTDGQCLLAYANALKAYSAGTGPAPTDCAIAAGTPPTSLPEASHTALLVVVGGVLVALLGFTGLRRRERRTI